MDILQAARLLRPGTAWNYDGKTLTQAEDGTPRVNPPTTQELEAVMAQDAHKDLRRPEYPSIEDQLDAIWKGGSALEEMRSRVMAVKAKYPKPE